MCHTPEMCALKLWQLYTYDVSHIWNACAEIVTAIHTWCVTHLKCVRWNCDRYTNMMCHTFEMRALKLWQLYTHVSHTWNVCSEIVTAIHIWCVTHLKCVYAEIVTAIHNLYVLRRNRYDDGRLWLWFSEIWRHVVWQISINVSEQPVAPAFSVVSVPFFSYMYVYQFYPFDFSITVFATCHLTLCLVV